MHIEDVDGLLKAPDGYERMFRLPDRRNEVLTWLVETAKREHRWEPVGGLCTALFESLAGPLDDVVLTRHPRGWPCLPHRHDFVELVYIYKGNIEQTVDGRETALREGDFCLLGPDAVHSFPAPGRADIVVNYLIQRAVFESLFIPLLGRGSAFSRVAQGEHQAGCSPARSLTISPRQNAWPHLTARRLIREYYTPGRRDPLLIRTLLMLLMRDLQEHLPDEGRNARSPSGGARRLDEVLDYIASNPAGASLRGAAARASASPAYVSRLVSRLAGASFTELVRRRRFLDAKSLLQTTEYPVDQVLEMVGYSNRTYFYREFRRRFHVTPGEVRALTHERSS